MIFVIILEIKLSDNIIVHTDVYAYDVFSLIVDLGSALGTKIGV